MSEVRIIAGQYRGRRIAVPQSGVRPTADRVREAWMSIIQMDIPDARCLDLCSGSGALGLELLSRGAEHCDFVEKDPEVVKVLQVNITTLAAGERATIHGSSAEQFVEGLVAKHPSSVIRPFDLAVTDPPYSKDIASSLAHYWLKSPFSTIFCLEHEAWTSLPEPADDASVDRRRYGDTALTIYRLKP